MELSLRIRPLEASNASLLEPLLTESAREGFRFLRRFTDELAAADEALGYDPLAGEPSTRA